MAKRNMEQLIVEGQGLLSERRSMTYSELTKLQETFIQKGLWDAVIDAYYFGISLGYRQAKEDVKGARNGKN